MSDSSGNLTSRLSSPNPFFICLLFAAFALPVNAYDQHIASTMFAEGYSIYRRNGTRISRRRFVEELTVGAWNILPGESDPYYKGPRLSVNLNLRVAGDAGVTQEETTPRYDQSYIPGVVPFKISAMTLYIEGRGFWDDTLDIRAGRQIRLGTLGFFAFDGAEVRMRLPIALDIATYIGLEVRGGQLLGYSALELDGTDRGSREGLEMEQYPDRQEPESRLAMGTEIRFFPWRWLEAAVAFRAVGIEDGAGALADQRVGGRLQSRYGVFEGSGLVVYSPMIATITEADASLGVSLLDVIALVAEYHRYVPVFEGDSIFNVFDLLPQNDAGGRVTVDIGSTVDLAVWGFARMADASAGLSGDATSSLLAGAGGGIGSNFRTQENRISARFTYVAEWGESRLGAELGGGHAFLRNNRLWLSARASYFHLDDDFSELYSGHVFGYILSAEFIVSTGFRILGEFEHYLGDGRGSRLNALALLELDLWR